MSFPVTLFIPCLADAFLPETGEALARILNVLNIEWEYPEKQTCCGQPAFNAGHRKAARTVAKHFIRVFEKRGMIVSLSGSCVHMIRSYYPVLFKNDPDWLKRAHAVGEKTFEFSVFLTDVLGVTDVGAFFSDRVTYHDSCHLFYGLGIFDQPRKLLNNVDGLTLIEMSESTRCCGFGGAFSVKYPEISTAILTEKVETILDTGAKTAIFSEPGCLLNIRGRLERLADSRRVPRTLHIAQVLAARKTK